MKYNALFDRKAPLLLAHRGFTPEAPENTLASFRAAARHHFFAIETDVHQTSDGVLVCCHDSSLRKMYGSDIIIEEATFSELKDLRVKVGNNVANLPDEDLRLPLFSEYLSICKKASCVPFIETKGNVVGEVLSMVEKEGLIDVSVLSSTDCEHIKEARRINRDIFIHHIFTDDECMMQIASLGNGGVSYNYPDLDKVPEGLIEKVHACGVRLCLRAGDTVDAVRRMMRMGLDYIPTNLMSPEQFP